MAGISVSYDIAVEPNKENSPPPPVSDVETLVLSHFSHPPRLDFGSVKSKQIKRCQLNIRNPNDVDLDVKIEKFPHKKGFSVESLEFMVEPMTTYPLYIDWTPDEPGNFREMVLCHVGGAFRVQAYLLGKCPEPPKPRKSVGKTIKSLRKPVNMIGRPQNRATNRASTAPKDVNEKNNKKCAPTAAPVEKSKGRPPLQPKVPNKENVGRNQNLQQNTMRKKTCNDHILSQPIKTNDIDARMTMRLSKPTVLPPTSDGLHYSKASVDQQQKEDLHLVQTYIHESTTTMEEVLEYDTQTEVYTSDQRKGFRNAGLSKSGKSRTSTVTAHTETCANTAGSETKKVRGRSGANVGTTCSSRGNGSGMRMGTKGSMRFNGEAEFDEVYEVEETVEEVVEYVDEFTEETIETEYYTIQEYVSKEEKGTKDCMLSERAPKDCLLSETVVFDKSQVTSSSYHTSTVTSFQTELSTSINTNNKTYTTAAKHLVPDDPNFPDTPTRRVTFIKDDPQLPDTPSRRVTFKKDDPAIPLTPVRRDTYLKLGNHLSNTPVISSPDSLNEGQVPSSPRSRLRMGVSSLTPKRKDTRSASPPRERHTLRFNDDSQIHKQIDKDSLSLDLTGSGNTPLSRYGTYTKLNGSISPRPVVTQNTLDHSPATTYSVIDDLEDFEIPCPVENPQPGSSRKNKHKKLSIISERSEKSERRSIMSTDSLDDQKIEEEDAYSMDKKVISLQSSPSGSKYATAYTTPYESPGLSDTEAFEDSVAYMQEDSPTVNTTVMENSQLMASILRDKLERVASFEGTPAGGYANSSNASRIISGRDYSHLKKDVPANDSIASLISLPKDIAPVPEFTEGEEGNTNLSEEEVAMDEVQEVSDKRLSTQRLHGECTGDEGVKIAECSNAVEDNKGRLSSTESVDSGSSDKENRPLHDSFSLLKTPGFKSLPPVPVFEDKMPTVEEDADESKVTRYPRQSSVFCARSPSMYGNPFNDTGLEVSTLGFDNETFLQREKMNLRDYGLEQCRVLPPRGGKKASFCWQENLNNNEFEENAKISRSRQSCKTTFVVDNFETAKNAHKVAEADECFMKDAVLLKTPQTKVQEEIKQRCSSTPYHRDPDTGIKDYDEGAGPTDFAKTPSPIIGRRVSRDTVTKPKASAALVNADLETGPKDGRVAKKGLVYEGDLTGEEATRNTSTEKSLEKDVVHIKPVAQMGDNAGFMETLKEGKLSTMLDEVCNKTEDPRRFSSLTVTKSKPSTELTHHGASDREKCERASNRRLFNSVCAVSEVKGKPRSDKVENDAKTCKWKRNSADITYKVEAEGEDLDRDTLNSCDMASNKPMVFQIDVSDCNKKINEESLTSQMSDHSRVGASWYKGETGAKSRLSKGGISARRSIADTRTMASFKDKPHQSGPARMKVVEETNSMLEVSPQKRDHSAEKSGERKRFRSDQTSRPNRQAPASQLSATGVSNDRKFNKPPNLRKHAALSSMAKSAQKFAGNLKKPAGTGKVVAKTKLTLIRQPRQTRNQALPKHPLAFAAKNVYYDERWMEKEEKGFVKWLNFILTPPDFYFDARKPKKIDAGQLFLTDNHYTLSKAPTKEVLSFRAYCVRRKLNRLRRDACRLYQGELFVGVQSKLEREITCKRLAIRTDRLLFADLGLKQKILEMLLSYNPLWLRIGLETIYGEVVHVQSTTDVFGLSQFIAHRFLGNPDIAAEFAHPTVPHLYRDGYYENLGQFTLKKYLMLVMFLDHAKRSRLILEDPCLFCKDSDFKSSKDLLLSFSRDFLSGEGDLVKHLTYMGYKVGHVQTPLEEVDYSVTNLATDLRDGIRLTRVVSLLTEDWTLLTGLRCPAISILQKVHNVGVALGALIDRNVDMHTARGGKIQARDVVDGHREKTLQLLWRIIFNFQVEQVIDEAKLRQEVSFLKNSLSTKKQQEALLCDLDPDALGLPRDGRDSMDPSDIYYKSDKLYLLLKWCRAVCAHYNVKVENFTVSFSDGRVLCLLLHYYHPELLPRKLIHMDTTQTHLGDADHSLTSDDSFSEALSYADVNSQMYEQLLKNEKENFKTLYEKVTELGGVPLMLRASDMSATIPDEKVVITYVSYLCGRLLDIRLECWAARTIQHAWRKYRVNRGRSELKERQEAAIIIQRNVKPFLQRCKRQRECRAAVTIQKCYRGYKVRKLLKAAREEAKLKHLAKMTVMIQACVRGHLVRRHIRVRQSSATVVQSAYRGWRQRCAYTRLRHAAFILQRRWRANRLCKEELEKFTKVKSAVKTLQSGIRCWLIERRLVKHMAASRIQASFRMLHARQLYKRQRALVVVLQSHIRAWLAWRKHQQLCAASQIIQSRFRALLACRKQRDLYTRTRAACLCLQKYTRGWLARKYAEKVSAVIKIQSAIRGHIQRHRFVALRNAAVVIQRRYRLVVQGQQLTKEYMRTKRNIVKVQACVRGYLARQRVKKLKSAALTIQRSFRGYIQRERLKCMREASSKIQAWFRGYLEMKAQRQRYQASVEAVVKIQSWFTMLKVSREYGRLRTLVVKMQALVRMNKEMKEYKRTKEAALVIQRRYRASRQRDMFRQQFLQKRKAAITVQSCVKMWIARTRFLHIRKLMVKMQALVRTKLARQTFTEQRQAVEKIQSYYRGYLVMRQQREQYVCLRENVVKIQSLVHMRQSRHSYLKLRQAAVFCQSLFRGRRERMRFLRKKSAATSIQRMFRAHYIVTVNEQMDRRLKEAVISIQAVVRGYLTRKRLEKLRKGVVKLQALARGRQQQRRFVQLKYSIYLLQGWWRACAVARRERERFIRLRQGLMRVQACYRGWIVRREYLSMKDGFTRLQAVWRMRVARTQYLKQREMVVCIQRRLRATLQARVQQMMYLHYRKCTTVLQAAVRAYCQRRRYQTMKNGMVRLQALHRMRKEKTMYEQLKNAVMVLQQTWRATKQRDACRQEFVTKRQAAVAIQAGFRGLRERRRYITARAGVIRLQALVRGVQCRRALLRLRAAVIVMQYRIRAVLLARRQRREFLNTRRAAVCLQSCYRCAIARKRYLTMKEGFSKLQAMYKARLVRRKFEEMKAAASKIQEWWRAMLLKAKEERKYMVMRGATIILQRAIRGYLCRKRHWALIQGVTKLQALYRCRLQRRDFVRHRNATIAIQRRWRATQLANQERTRYLHTREALVLLQSAVRGHIQRSEFVLVKESAIKLQAAWKGIQQRRRYRGLQKVVRSVQTRWRARVEGKKARLTYHRQRNAARYIQGWYRGMQQKRHLAQSSAAVRLQACWRGYRQRCEYRRQLAERVLRRQAATVILQHHIWRYVMKKRAMKELKRKVSCVVRLQALMRGYLARKRLKETIAMICLQAAVRGFLVRQRTVKTKRDIVNCQSTVRMWQCRRKFVRLKWAVTTVQRHWKARTVGKMVRDQLILQHEKATVIQTCYRRRRARTRFVQFRAGVVELQRVVRCFLYRKHYEKVHRAATTVQMWWRRVRQLRVDRMVFVKKVKSTRVIQRHVRRYLARKRRLQEAAVKIQAAWRGHLFRSRLAKLTTVVTTIQRRFRECREKLREKRRERAVLKIQSVMRGYLARRKYIKLHKAIVLAQSLWRGRRVRLSIQDARIKKARVRVQKAADKATEDQTLASRTISALDFLLRCKNLGTILGALIDLDVVTKLLPECCERLVEANAVHVLYKVILGSNRSVPHQELIRYSVSTLLNLAKYDKTADAVYSGVDSVHLLVDMMSIYRDKKCMLFPQLCTLLGIIGHNQQVQQDVQEIPRFNEKLRSIQTLVARKHKMEANRQKAAARMAAMKSFNCTLPLLPPAVKKRARVKPEWVLKKGNLSHIKDPLEAIDFVLETFSISPK